MAIWCDGAIDTAMRMARDVAEQSELDYDIDNNILLGYDNGSDVIETRCSVCVDVYM